MEEARKYPAVEGIPVKLHIGGREARPGWTVVNAQPGPNVDVVGDLRDMSAYPDDSVAEIYTSHTLEHLDHAHELRPALKGLFRILAPGGRLMVAVPDLETLCRMMVHEQADANLRLHLMRIIYGGQVDEWDYHKSGFTSDLLAAYLGDAGFANVERVPEFGLFDDTSNLKIAGVPVSLNVVAYKSKNGQSAP